MYSIIYDGRCLVGEKINLVNVYDTKMQRKKSLIKKVL